MKSLDAKHLKELLLSAANNLYNHYPEIDQLNVFPVPDGDTGMNMNLTVSSGVMEIEKREFSSCGELSEAFSRGLLMGARGNSGVITSQIFKGLALGFAGKEEIDCKTFAFALEKGREIAYKAVMKPVEGTILTLIKDVANAVNEKANSFISIPALLSFISKEAKASLKRTPELLPILKQVGVVDSGAAGLEKLFEGMALAASGKPVERTAVTEGKDSGETNIPLYAGATLEEDEAYGYCTQFVLRIAEEGSGKKVFDEKKFSSFIYSHGKSGVIAFDKGIAKVHIHTLTPGNMLNYAQQFGEFVSITIENMSEEHNNIKEGRTATDFSSFDDIKDEYGIVAVSNGKGLDDLFKSLGVSYLVSGGQTNNPSTEDFILAIKKAKAKNVFVYPNNGNIIMAAKQAAEFFADKGINVIVIQSKTIPQGLASIMRFDPSRDVSSNEKEMSDALHAVKTGSVTYAIRDTDIDGVHITKGYYMSMKGKSIVSCVKDKVFALKDLIDSFDLSDASILTIYAGEDISDRALKNVTRQLFERYGDSLQIDVFRGDQPVYSFLVALE